MDNVLDVSLDHLKIVAIVHHASLIVFLVIMLLLATNVSKALFLSRELKNVKSSRPKIANKMKNSKMDLVPVMMRVSDWTQENALNVSKDHLKM